ncbi:MAG: arylsulfatase [Gemmataceae bacterium]|nr:arylsulfatase [Gemmataceae bacterium]
MRILIAIGLCLMMANHAHAGEAKKPNIVIIIADDLGWRDVGWQASEIKTPNMDKLVKAGVRLERHYVYPTCSPTRAGMFTGRNSSRFGIHAPIAQKSEQALPMNTLTLARLLRRAGYFTGIIGKWHLGLRPEVGPRQFGFDSSYGYFHGQIDPFTHLYRGTAKTWHRNDKFVEEKGHVTDLISDEAVRFVETKRKQPFFLWVAHATPHYPLAEEEKWIAPYKDTIKNESRRLYAASITHMDDGIGRIVTALEKSKQLDNTLIVFTSDNGGFEKYESKIDYDGKYSHLKLGDNTPLRGWKGQLYEGGVRVAAFAYWRGKLQPASAPEIVSMLDWYPTMAKLAGADVPASTKLEGRDVWPILSRKGEKPADPEIYWNTGAVQGVMAGELKLIVNTKKQQEELYDLRNDALEATNLAATRPNDLALMRKRLQAQRDADAK